MEILSQMRANEKLPRKAATIKTIPKAPKKLPVATAETKQENDTDALKAQETKLSEDISKLEAEYGQLVGEAKEALAAARHNLIQFDQYYASLRLEYNHYLQQVAKFEEVKAKLAEVTQAQQQKTKLREELQRQIAEATSLPVCVYADGQIEPMDDSPEKLNFAGWKKLYETLLRQKECENLRVRDIQTLAKVLAAVKNCPATVVAVFDDSELEEVFRVLSPVYTAKEDC